MASKRYLKKQTNYIIESIFTVCWIHYLQASPEQKEPLEKLLSRILAIRNEFITRIGHPEPGNVKGFYKKLHKDFDHEINLLIEETGKLS